MNHTTARYFGAFVLAAFVLQGRVSGAFREDFDSPMGPNGQVLYESDERYRATGVVPSGGDRNGNPTYLNGFIIPDNEFEPFTLGGWGTITHDQSGTGNYLYSGTQNMSNRPLYGGVLWSRENVEVSPSTAYVFSFYLTNSSNNFEVARIRPYINDVPLSPEAVSAHGTFSDGFEWQEFSFPWASGSATSARLVLRNETETGRGNDFGIDTISLTEHPIGDYNGNGRVEQADLDLVLLNWGASFDTLPDEWKVGRPSAGIIDQAELDSVLLNWGSDLHGVSVPEPTSWACCAVLLLCIVACRLRGL